MNARQMYNLMKRSGSIYSDSYIQNKIRNDFGVVKRWNPVQPDEEHGNCMFYNRVERCYMNENFRIGRIIRDGSSPRFVWDDEVQTSLFDSSMQSDVFTTDELNKITRAWNTTNPQKRILGYHCGTSIYNHVGILRDGADDNSWTIGFELETNLQSGTDGAICRRDDIIGQSIDVRLGHFAYDGSVSGVEFISHTFTWNKLLKCKDLMKAQFQEMSESGLVASDSAGLHIHVGRNAFVNEKALKKFFYIVNHGRLQDSWEKLARRNQTTYCTYANLHDGDIGMLNRSMRTSENTHGVAVNQQHSKSIEVRIFKATLSADILYGTIEALMNLIKFCNSDVAVFNFTDLFRTENAQKLIRFGIVNSPSPINIAFLIGRSREQIQTLINEALTQGDLSNARQLMDELEEAISEGGE